MAGPYGWGDIHDSTGDEMTIRTTAARTVAVALLATGAVAGGTGAATAGDGDGTIDTGVDYSSPLVVHAAAVDGDGVYDD
ncbi:hypothetical protein DY218_27610 [Streptomyces triticagri]|uniref:Uncharacterized protein n=1 Tax=Streptomyces triticagri TaxID=2293568 RepID=A0A372LXV5_9ACTN|nr:hypothetical protein [Streptomyces triticagri]RFU83461.1 hypothetical protein DY218_27610 [Streptomyces triticagri]